MSKPKRMTIQQIIDGYNQEVAWNEEYDLSEDSSHAEFCSSFGYGEATVSDIVEHAYKLEDETIEAIKAAGEKYSSKMFLELLQNHCELKLVGIYREFGEIYSCQIGEYEHQPSDDLLNAYLALTPKSQAKVRKSVNGYISDSTCKGWIYTSHDYDRFVMVLNEETFMEDPMLLARIALQQA